MRIGIVSLGGKTSKLVAQSCRKYFEFVDELNLKNFKVKIHKNGIDVTYEKKDLEKYDCMYIRGSYRYALLQRAIVRVLSKDVYLPLRGNAFAIGHDKFLTLIEIHKNGIEIPTTYYAATTKLAKKMIEEEVDYPVIMKVPRGTHGKGVMIAESIKSAKTLLDMLETFKEPYILQEFVQTEQTSDIRAIVVGNEVVASYIRKAKIGEFRANTHLGGSRIKHEITKEQEKMVVNAAKAINSEICGVDILNSDRPSVIEINLSPSFHAVEECTGVNVCDIIAKYLFEQTKKFKKRLKKKNNKIND